MIYVSQEKLCSMATKNRLQAYASAQLCLYALQYQTHINHQGRRCPLQVLNGACTAAWTIVLISSCCHQQVMTHAAA